MEKDSPSKPSVAELAGRFKGHILPMPTSNDEKTSVPPNPLKIKTKNSAIIEKLQANLALSPTALLPSPKSPEVTLQPAPLSPSAPCGPLSPTLRPSRLSSEEEDPVSFSDPPEGTPLPSINKTRARLSFKRRPPTRQHRRSAGEEAGAFGSAPSPCELHCRKENGDEEQVFDSPAEGGEPRQTASAEEVEEKNGDCENADDDEVAKRDPDNSRDRGMEQEAEEIQSLKTLEEEGQESSELCPTKQMEGNVKTEEGQGEVAQEEHQGGDDQM